MGYTYADVALSLELRWRRRLRVEGRKEDDQGNVLRQAVELYIWCAKGLCDERPSLVLDLDATLLVTLEPPDKTEEKVGSRNPRYVGHIVSSKLLNRVVVGAE